MSNENVCSLNESSITIDMTPPIRRVAADALSSIPSIGFDSNSSKSTEKVKESSYDPQVSRQRSTSSTSSSSSNNNSLRSFSVDSSVHQDDEDDDGDDVNQQWNSDQTNRRISIIDDNRRNSSFVSQCKICLEELSIEPLRCCASSICSKCIYHHLSINILDGRIRISCPSCSHIFTREEILVLLMEHDERAVVAERYKRIYTEVNRETHIKTCPQCCSIKEVDKRLCEGIRRNRTIPRKVFCDECQFEWCFFCHAPWHDKMTCKEYQKGEKMLHLWASQTNHNQQNAQQCPGCKVYISRNGGCPHMVCTKCQCDFCYNCGRRRFDIKFLGSHDSRFSPLGCKFNLYPDKPILRHTVRGLIAGAATLAAPVAAVGAVALLAVGTTIGAPTYGTYRLIKHIRSKREKRRQRSQMETMSKKSVDGSDERTGDIDDLQKALEASLITFREEIGRRDLQNDFISFNTVRLSEIFSDDEDDDDDDDDDDSFDD